MPLDGDLPEITLKSLPAILRDRNCWPKDFKWNYGSMNNCAIGLVAALHNETPIKAACRIEKSFNISIRELVGIFCCLRTTYGISGEITPEHVADAIDKFILSHELPAKKQNYTFIPLNIPIRFVPQYILLSC